MVPEIEFDRTRVLVDLMQTHLRTKREHRPPFRLQAQVSVPSVPGMAAPFLPRFGPIADLEHVRDTIEIYDRMR